MKPIRADFARRRSAAPVLWVVVGVAALTAGWLLWDTAESRRQIATLRAELAALEQAASDAGKASQVHAVPPPAAYDASAREMLAQATIPWPQVLVALETVQIAGVRVQSLEYVAVEKQARVEIAAARQELALEFVNALNAGIPSEGAAWRWTIVRMDQTAGDRLARAQLLARWADR
jgi:hypothetical protein